MTHNIDEFVGRRIRGQRHALGLSQTEVAEAVGVKFQQLQKYEAATNRVSASRLHMISQVLKMPVDQFFPGDAFSDDMRARTTEEGILLTKFRLMPEKTQRLILELLELMEEAKA